MIRNIEKELYNLEEQYRNTNEYDQPLKLFFYKNLYKVIRKNIKKLEKIELKQKLNSISLESIMIYFKANKDVNSIFNEEELLNFLEEYLEEIKYPNLRRLQLELESEESKAKTTKNIYSFSKIIYFYSAIVSYLENEIINKYNDEKEINDIDLNDLYLWEIYDYYENTIEDKSEFNIDNEEQIRELLIEFLER